MSTVSCQITHQAQIVDVSTGTLANASFPLTQIFSSSLTSPTKEYAGTRSTTGETIDLTSTLANPFGTTLNFGTVNYIFVQNLSGTATLTIGGGSNAFFSGEQYTIGPLGGVSIVTAFTIDGTHKNLKVLPSSGTVSYSLIVVGT